MLSEQKVRLVGNGKITEREPVPDDEMRAFTRNVDQRSERTGIVLDLIQAGEKET